MFNLDTFLTKKVYQEIQVFENASWPFELDSCAFVSMIMLRSMGQTSERFNL